MTCDLQGRGILVTRARHQAASLCAMISASGGRPISFPAIEIQPVNRCDKLAWLLAHIDRYQILIFISPNAVHWALKMLGERALPSSAMLAAVGKSTANALAAAGYSVVKVPGQRFNSEALLEMPELSRVEHQHIMIFRGRGGRPLLGASLESRGALVEYTEVYQRIRPQVDPGSLIERWPEDVDLVTATSNEILQNLFSLLGQSGSALLQRTSLVVISQRMAAKAKALGCSEVIQAHGADDTSLINSICAWANDRYN